MDPFNKLIINNQNLIYKILTINRFHHTVLFHHGLRRQMGIFYNTIDEEKISVSKREAFKKRICFIGRFSKEKNLELLLKCFNLINNIELVIIGSEIINDYKKNKNIIWRGLLNKEEIIKELYDCDYLIVPSISEGLPFVILEAMNIGIPCIYSNIMGANELIKTNGERGFTFELEGYKKCIMNINWDVFDEVYKYFNKNLNNIYQAIMKAYSISIDDWNNMSEKCKKFVKKKYFSEKTNKKNLETFEII
jgi:glycosyltransferase involved in cell wall biosynthesis